VEPTMPPHGTTRTYELTWDGVALDVSIDGARVFHAPLPDGCEMPAETTLEFFNGHYAKDHAGVLESVRVRAPIHRP
jgi:hypothetical protein